VAVETIGRYEILGTLGKGAMGIVYLARDPLIDRRVALKTLRVDLDSDIAAEFRERFFREAQAAGRLNHPAIVTVHDVGEDPDSGLVYIAMEYIEGRNLKEILADGGRMAPAEAARITATVAQGLDYAHRMGVVHRDVKQANIMLTADGTAKITDFGVARLESSDLTVEGQFIGTPNYMSPEQITAKPVDGRSDLFSLGVVLYELLTGQRPFAGSTMHEVTMKIVRESPPIPSTVRPGLPAAFNPVVLRCLEKDPDKRFQSASELAEVATALARSLGAKMAAAPVRPGPAPRANAAGPTTTQAVAPAPTLAQKQPEVRAPERPVWAGIRLPRIPLPQFLRWEVTPAWAWRVGLGWAALWVAVIVLLATQRGGVSAPAPSDSTLANLHEVSETLRRAGHLLDSGQLEAAQDAAREVLDQMPASPAARAIAAAAGEGLIVARDSAATRGRVEELIAEGRRLYRETDFPGAAEQFREALALDEGNELASSFLDLAEERSEAARRASRSRPTPVARRVSTPAPRVQRQEAPGTARVTLFFNSPINAGSLLVTIDGKTLAQVSFDFTRRGMLGIKRKGTGQVKRVMLTPSGTHTIGVQLTDAETGPRGFGSFREQLVKDSDWTLRVDLPKDAEEASFFLIRARR